MYPHGNYRCAGVPKGFCDKFCRGIEECFHWCSEKNLQAREVERTVRRDCGEPGFRIRSYYGVFQCSAFQRSAA